MALPRHIAIIMDGNGRWAKQRHSPRIVGHRAGVEAVRQIVSGCANRGVEVLTLFAFSSENWRRPAGEVGLLMELFLSALQEEVHKLHANNVRLRVIGDQNRFIDKLQQCIAESEALTAGNDGLTLVLAANYGGRWDICQAMHRLCAEVRDGKLPLAELTVDKIDQYVMLSELPEPDLFIRSGGEQRISNYLLWQLAYTELYFTDCLWPDFDDTQLQLAIDSFTNRERRFGRTTDQVRDVPEKKAQVAAEIVTGSQHGVELGPVVSDLTQVKTKVL